MTSIFERLDKIDRLVADGPKEAGYFRDCIEPILGHDMAQRYFYEEIDDPSWLPILQEAGVFRTPPGVIEENDGSRIAPPWYPIEALPRLAAKGPDAAVSVLREIPATDNWRVHAYQYRAILELPIQQVRRFLPQVLRWISHQELGVSPAEIPSVGERLADAGLIEDALTAYSVILGFKLDEESGKAPLSRTSLNTRLDLWHYEKVIQSQLVALADEYPRQVFELLSTLLSEAQAVRHGHDTRPNDYSHYWQSDLERTVGHREGVRSILFNGVRDVSRKLVRTTKVTYAELASVLATMSWNIYRRLSLHLLSEVPARQGRIPLITRWLTSYEAFSEPELRKEYIELLRAHFGKMDDADQEIVLNMIDEGPNIFRFREWHEKVEGEQPTQAEAAAFAGQWRRDRLKLIGDHLPHEWQEQLGELESKYGEANDISEPFRIEREEERGSDEPDDLSRLRTMEPGDVVAYLSEGYVEEKEGLTGQPSEVGRIVNDLVREDPLQYSQYSSAFRKMEIEFVRQFINGLLEGVKSASPQGERDSNRNTAFNWSEVLDLCKWISLQPSTSGGTRHDDSEGQEWRGIKRRVVDLVTAGFESSIYPLPLSCQNKIFRIFAVLANDIDPEPEDEEGVWEGEMDPFHMAINRVRSEAVRGTIRTGLWLHEEQSREAPSPPSLDSLNPAIRPILEERLDIERDPSLAVRAMYGRFYPWLMLLDEVWVKEWTGTIFPREDHLEAYWLAAWNTYIRYCQAFDACLAPLWKSYERAVARTGRYSPEGQSSGPDNPHEGLASHIMAFYWRGKLSDPGRESLIHEFFEGAPPELCAKALEFVGRSLRNTEDDVPQAIRMRLRKLWEWRVNEITEAGYSGGAKRELGAFVGWFLSGKLEEKWSLDRLSEVLARGASIEWGIGSLIDQLSVLANKYPSESSRVLLHLVRESDQPDMTFLAWKDDLIDLLGLILESDDQQAKNVVSDVVEVLGRNGYYREVRDLARAL